MKRNSLKGSALLTISIFLSMPMFADEDEEAKGQKGDATEESIAADLANPLAPITTMSLQLRSEFGNGPDDDMNFTLRLQPSFFKPFEDNSALLLRSILPVQYKDWPESSMGLGDVTLVPYYVPDTTKSLFVGYGMSLGLPVATEPDLGGDQWTAGPAVILAKTGRPVTYGGLAQHVWSYAGDPDRNDISVTTLQPFVTCLLGDGWAATLTSEVAYDWYARRDNWTIPLSLSLSKVVKVWGEYFSVGLGAVDYVVGPSYLPDCELRLSFTYVFR